MRRSVEAQVERVLDAMDQRMAMLEERSAAIEHEIGSYLKQLNTVLNGLTTINNRLVKEKTDPAVAIEKMQRSGLYQSLIDRISGLEDDVTTWWDGLKSLKERIDRLESVLEARDPPCQEDDKTTIYTKDGEAE